MSEVSGTIEALFHTFNAWTGMCGCGAGPFVTAEHRHHLLAVSASPGCDACAIDATTPPTDTASAAGGGDRG